MPPLGVTEYLEPYHHLYPVQRFILKLVYGEAFDDTRRDIEIRSPLGEESFGSLTEAEYLEYLHFEERCNVSVPDPAGYRLVALCMGRRSGRNHLVALMQAYEAYLASYDRRLIFSSLSVTHGTALQRSTCESVRNVVGRTAVISREAPNFFSVDNGRSQFQFTSLGARDSGARYAQNFFSLHDAAFMGQPAWTLMDDLIPSINTQNARLVLESSAHDQPSYFRQVISGGSRFGSGFSNWLTLRIPTWEANPTLSAQFFADHRVLFSGQFSLDFGAEFPEEPAGGAITITGGAGGYMPSMWLTEPVISNLYPAQQESSHSQEEPFVGPLKTRIMIIEESFQDEQNRDS